MNTSYTVARRSVGKPQRMEDGSSPKDAALWSVPFIGYIGIIAYDYLGVDSPAFIPQLAPLRLPLVIALFLLLYTWNRHGFSRLWSHAGFKLQVVFIILTIFAMVHGLIQTLAIDPVKQQLGYLALVVSGAYLLNTAARVRIFCSSMVFIHCFLAIANWDKFSSPVRVGGFIGGTFLGDGNDQAWSLTIVGPMALYLAYTATKKFERFFWIGLYGVLLFAVVGTQSRGATLALISSLFYLWINVVRKKHVGVLVAVLMAVFAGVAGPSGYFDRMETIANYQEDTSATNRLRAWRRAIEMAMDNPILGVGAGSFNSAYGRLYRQVDDGDAVRWISTHSIYFKVLAEYGFGGAAIFVGMIVWMYRQNRRSLVRLRSPPKEDLAWAATWLQFATASIVAYAVAGMFLTGVDYPHRFLLMAITLSIAILIPKEDPGNRRAGGPVARGPVKER